MNIIENLVTDRTKSDVDYIQSQTQKGIRGMTEAELDYFLRGEPTPVYALDGPLQNTSGRIYCMNGVVKGSYNATDLNRVNAAVKYLAELYRQIGYSVNVSTKTGWAEQDFPCTSDAEVYIANISELRGKITMPESTPEVPTDMEGLTYKEANDIEKILFDCDKMISIIKAAWFYSGDLYMGEV